MIIHRALGLGATFLAACTSVHSDSIKTSGMSAHFTVTAGGDGNTAVTASLWVDDNSTDTVDLTDGDVLTAKASSQSQAMTRDDSLGAISYDASFTGLDAAGTAYTIALTRPTDVSAPSSTCSMPAPFALGTPAAGGTFSRASDAIAITYSPSGGTDPMSLTAIGSCVNYSLSFPDTGTVTLAKGALVNASAQQGQCEVTLQITRTRAGQLDHAYGYGGNIACTQVRQVSFTSSP